MTFIRGVTKKESCAAFTEFLVNECRAPQEGKSSSFTASLEALRPEQTTGPNFPGKVFVTPSPRLCFAPSEELLITCSLETTNLVSYNSMK